MYFLSELSAVAKEVVWFKAFHDLRTKGYCLWVHQPQGKHESDKIQRPDGDYIVL